MKHYMIVYYIERGPPMALLTSNLQTKTETTNKTKHEPKGSDGQLSNEPYNTENTPKLGENEPAQHVLLLLHLSCSSDITLANEHGVDRRDEARS